MTSDTPNIMTEEKLREITEAMISLLLKKNSDYGNASFDLGSNGNMVHLWDKVTRYRTQVENLQKTGNKPNFESIDDTLRDIIGYAIIGLLILEKDRT